jgi:hypothetical protein
LFLRRMKPAFCGTNVTPFSGVRGAGAEDGLTLKVRTAMPREKT